MNKKEKPQNTACPACREQRQHTKQELGPPHHKWVGHGYTKEHGWSHPDLAAEVENEAKKVAA